MVTEVQQRPGGAAGAAGTVAAGAVPRRATTGRMLVSGPRAVLSLIGLIVVALIMAAPFLWLLSASLKPRSQVFDHRLIPDPVAWDNYARVWDVSLMPTWAWNSVVVAGLAALTVTISSALVAFGFAYFRFRGRELLFGLVLATMMLPMVVTMIPQFLIWNELGWTDTLVPLWAGNLFGSAFYIFLDLMRPLVYLRDVTQFTIPLGLKTLLDQFGQGGEMQWEIILAASVIATIPMVVIFLLAQRAFVEGIATTGTKG